MAKPSSSSEIWKTSILPGPTNSPNPIKSKQDIYLPKLVATQSCCCSCHKKVFLENIVAFSCTCSNDGITLAKLMRADERAYLLC